MWMFSTWYVKEQSYSERGPSVSPVSSVGKVAERGPSEHRWLINFVLTWKHLVSELLYFFAHKD